MNIIFFDCETNGKPKRYNAPMGDVDNWPRVSQLSWIVTDDKALVWRKQNHVIYPDGWTIPEEEFFINNGHSTAKCSVDGIPMNMAIDLFMWDYQHCDVMVSHNMAFDFNCVGAEMLRYGKRANKQATRLCTMELSTNVCKLPGQYGKYKWPKLEELHRFLFDKDFEGAHDSLNDVIALRDCFFELVKRDVIKFNTQPA